MEMMRKLLAFPGNPYLGLPPNWELMKQSVTACNQARLAPCADNDK